MKKLFLTAMVVFTFGAVNAQEVKFGAKGGLNFATITNDDGAKNQVGFHLGVTAEFKVSDKFAVQPELLYSGQGAKYEGGSTKLNYINLPVMAKFYVAEQFSLEAGPQIGFLMSATQEIGSNSVDVKDFLKSTDFGFNLGAGYDIDEAMTIGLRYNMGLTQVQKELSQNESANKNAVIQLSFGYKF